MSKLLSILIFILLPFNAFSIDLKIPKTDEEWLKASESLNWIDGPRKMNFVQANSKIDINSNYVILENEDANQFMYWSNGVQFSYVKIYAYNVNDNSQIYFFYDDAGYVKTDDWTKVDPVAFINEIRENYKAANDERQKNNLSYVVDVNWKKKPYLDGINNSVYYALNISWSDNSSTQEGTALILGREGYTTGKYIAGDNGYNEQTLLNLSKIHKFNATKEYKDWKSGDKVAAVGIGALLASTLGIKALKPGIVAGVLLFLKKFWFIIFLPFIWLGKLFTGSKKKRTK